MNINPNISKRQYQLKLSKNKLFFVILAYLFVLGSFQDLYSDSSCPEFGTGWRRPTSEQLQKMEETYPRIVGVRPNKIGLERIRPFLKNQGKDALELTPATAEEEFITVIGNNDLFLASNDIFPAVPSSVNNATLSSFPPIGNQQQEGSCTAWASTYYQASQELGLLNGYNNKTSNTHVLSPRWTYNLINDGYDGGSWPDDAYAVLASNGAVSIQSFPYINGEYTGWDLNAQDWVSAIYNRMSPVQYISGIDVSKANLPLIKQLLTNGHVLTFGTYAYSWVFTTIKNDPSYPNPYVGQQACTYVNGTSGAHFVTIVGYDDNLWIDVNGNGQIDSGEKGAFLIANSWGSSWGNSGFFWMSYDALLQTSAVVNGPSRNRQPAMEDRVYSTVPKSAKYSPKLVGQFSLNQTYRNQISIQGGYSDTLHTTPNKTFNCFALQNHGGALGFDGSSSTTPKTGTFTVDLTDLLVSNQNSRYYLTVKDNRSGNPTNLTNFTLLDTAHNTKVNYSKTLPLTCDNSQLSAYIDYNFTTNTNDTVPPTVQISSPSNNATVKNVIPVNVTAADNIAVQRVELYADSSLLSADTASPYQFSVNTTLLTNGLHTLTAVAYDTTGNSARSNITVNVQNSTSNAIYVNCGDSALTYNDISYQADFGFTSWSTDYNYDFAPVTNPVYKTNRYGNDFHYNFAVPNGTYAVTLMFAEIYWQQANGSVFNVALNNTPVLSKLDVYAKVGYCVPYTPTFTVNVTNGTIDIHLTSIIEYAWISGIQIKNIQ